ncbi:MAG: hypothetical protein DRR06_14665 [Gammaproteobacteria bacterium]|nr:MAG: hypothetical protein DRR06_14665 [Gammaproteobacteria bacterium]
MTDEQALASLAVASNAYLDEYVTDDKAKLMPAFSVHHGHAYSVIPAIRKVKKTVGRGKDKTEVDEQEAQMVAITDDHRWLPYDNDVLSNDGLFAHEAPYIPQPPFRWHQKDAIRYVREQQTGRNTKDVFEELVDIWHSYAEFGAPVYYKILALYVLQTYMYTVWPATGYVHFNGTAGSGKSRCLQVIEAIGYNGRAAMNISPSAMFRTINGNPGVLCIDEAEAFKSEKDAEVYKLLLGGYDEHGQAIINDKVGDTYRPTAYLTYCPKAVASISLLDSTLGSRTLIVPMVPAFKQPEELPPDGDWRYLRNDLHIWALQNAVQVQRFSRAWDSHSRFDRAKKLINRAWQIARPYIVLAASFDERLADELIDWFNDYYIDMQQMMQQADKNALVLKCLPQVIREKPPIQDEFFNIGQIHDVVLEHLEDDQHDYYKSKHTNDLLTALRIGEIREIQGKRCFRLNEALLRKAFAQRMIKPFDEDKDWFDGKTSYYSAPDSVQTAMAEFNGW